jgi:hypothetical protein
VTAEDLCWQNHPDLQSFPHYGFHQKAPQGENQQAQTAQEAAFEPPQEAHLAEIILPRNNSQPSAARLRAVFFVP